TSTDGSSDVVYGILVSASFIWALVVLLLFIDSLADGEFETAKVNEPEAFWRTRVFWASMKCLLWPLFVLGTVIIMIVVEWCIPGWKWCRANTKEWCTCAGANAWTCDTCCFKNCRDACDVLVQGRGDHRGVADLESQTALTEGVMNNQPSNTLSMEVLPTYNQATDATKPTGL
ncbi:hypothetical protein QBC32DRAFT_378175, partial [Pseudoneurospora amorphoporcata]